MQCYFFVLGKNPSLSIAEIIAVLKKIQITYRFLANSNEIVIISTNNTLDVLTLMKSLGGTVKIGKIINEVNLDEDESRFYQVFTVGNLLNQYFPKINSKLHLGVSLYNGGGDVGYLTLLFKQLKDLNVMIKENLQQIGKKVGFVRIKDRYLTSVSVYKNQLLEKGVEIVIILTPISILVGKTLAVQEFAYFSFRDYGRPARDKRSGILPPKLARIMINLAGVDAASVILDPFCGSGTILQEAIILGYKNIIGSDVSSKAIVDTRSNIDWLFEKFRTVKKSSYNIRFLQTDSQSLTKHFHPSSIDAIVTEPYLGPPLFKKPSISTIKKILAEVSSLYLDTFSQLAEVLKQFGKAVFIFPVFAEDDRLHFVEILDEVKKLGFRQRDFLNGLFLNQQTLGLTLRRTIIYGSEEQFLKREILSFERIV